jgi:hypothetical protein
MPRTLISPETDAHYLELARQNDEARAAHGMPDLTRPVTEQVVGDLVSGAVDYLGRHGVIDAVEGFTDNLGTHGKHVAMVAAMVVSVAGGISVEVGVGNAGAATLPGSHPSVMAPGSVWQEGQAQGFTTQEWAAANPGIDPYHVYTGRVYNTPNTTENEPAATATVAPSAVPAGSHPSVMPAGSVWQEGQEQGFTTQEWAIDNPGVNPAQVYAGHVYNTPNTAENMPSGSVSVAAAAPANTIAGVAAVTTPAASHPSVMPPGSVWQEGQAQGFTTQEWAAANPGVDPSHVYAGRVYNTPSTAENTASGNIAVPAATPANTTAGVVTESSQAPATVQSSSVNNTLLEYGDSLVVGTNEGGIAAAFAANGFNVLGVDGTVGATIPEITQELVANAAQAKTAGTLVLEEGTNECDVYVAVPACDSAAEVEAQLQAQMTQIHALAPQARVYVVGPHVSGSNIAASVIQAMENLSSTDGFTFINWDALATANPTGLYFDQSGVHLQTVAGYHVMGEIIANAIGKAPTPTPAPTPATAVTTAPTTESPNITASSDTGIVPLSVFVHELYDAGITQADGIAGIVGNVWGESGIYKEGQSSFVQPNRLQSTPFGVVTPYASITPAELANPREGWDEFQETPITKFTNWALANKLDPNSLKVQIQFMVNQIRNTHLFADLNNPDFSASSDALAFLQDFEIPQNLSALAPGREAVAMAYLPEVEATLNPAPVAPPTTTTTLPTTTTTTTVQTGPESSQPQPVTSGKPSGESTTSTTLPATPPAATHVTAGKPAAPAKTEVAPSTTTTTTPPIIGSETLPGSDIKISTSTHPGGPMQQLQPTPKTHTK